MANRPKPPADPISVPIAHPIADWIARTFRELQKASQGGYEQRKGSDKSGIDWTLLDHISNTIIRAGHERLLDSDMDLKQIAPDAAQWIDAFNQYLSQRTQEASKAAITDPDQHAGQEKSRDRRSHEPTSDSSRDWEYNRIQIAQLLADIEEHGDPGEERAEIHLRMARLIVAAVWGFLQDKYPQRLWPELAYNLSQQLTGIDPWLGAPEDFLQASWVCDILASGIEERCDLSVSEAAMMSGIDPGAISRACSEGKIKCVGKYKSRRINRASFFDWWKKRDQAVQKKKRREAASSQSMPISCCRGCDLKFFAQRNACPRCGTAVELLPASSLTKRSPSKARNPRRATKKI